MKLAFRKYLVWRKLFFSRFTCIINVNLQFLNYILFRDRKDQFEGELRCVKEVLKIYETKFPSLEKEVQCLECDVYELTCRKANFEDELKHRKPASEKDRALVLDLRKKVKALGKERKEASTEKLAKERLVAELTRKIYELGLEYFL